MEVRALADIGERRRQVRFKNFIASNASGGMYQRPVSRKERTGADRLRCSVCVRIVERV